MSANGLIVEQMTRHQVMVQRLASGHVKKLMPILDSMHQDIQSRIRASNTEFQLFRFQSLLNDVNRIAAIAEDKLVGEISEQLIDFAEYESDFITRMIQQFVNVDLLSPSEQQLAGALNQTVTTMVSGDDVINMSVRQLVDQFTSAKRREIDSAIRAGFIEGLTPGEMASRVQSITGVKAPRQAATLIRTATNHMATQARKEVYQANSDVIEKEEWVSTLDNRTTLICMGRDGQFYPVGQGHFPPAHFNCRSVRVPKVASRFSLLTDDAGERASQFGPVSAKRTYGGWLRDQSKEFQNDVLGPERAKLFRSGKVSIDKFTDDMGRTLTLDELRLREGLTLR